VTPLRNVLDERRRTRGFTAALVLTLVAVAASTWVAACTHERAPAVVLQGRDGPVRVEVEVALTREEQERGLMWRDHLDPDAGMLFVFRAQVVRSFWMKNTPLPLDIVFIDKNRRIVSIAERTTPFSLASIRSAGPAKYVLEVNGGFCREHGVQAGTSVELIDVSEHPSAAASVDG
jgi:uncharacterized membrane protein (UPF0127 family)